jgi:hypothetical protein
MTIIVAVLFTAAGGALAAWITHSLGHDRGVREGSAYAHREARIAREALDEERHTMGEANLELKLQVRHLKDALAQLKHDTLAFTRNQ